MKAIAMTDVSQCELDDIRQLALTPTPQNYLVINSKLEAIAAFIGGIMAAQGDGNTPVQNPAIRTFLRQLPQQMAHVRTMMEAPCVFFQGLEKVSALHFGSYERSGSIRSLRSDPHGKTLVHL